MAGSCRRSNNQQQEGLEITVIIFLMMYSYPHLHTHTHIYIQRQRDSCQQHIKSIQQIYLQYLLINATITHIMLIIVGVAVEKMFDDAPVFQLLLLRNVLGEPKR